MNRRRLSGYTPADLQNMGFFLDAVHFFADDPRDVGLAESPTLTASEPDVAGNSTGAAQAIQEPVATLTVAAHLASEPNLNTAEPQVGRDVPVEPPPAVSILNGCTPPVKVRRVRRSKVSKLPEDVRDNLNTLLYSGKSYSHIIRWLNTQGHIGFNKVNLHNWRVGGFQDWRQTTLTVGRDGSELPSPDVSGSRSLGIEPDLAEPNLNTESEFPGQASPG